MRFRGLGTHVLGSTYRTHVRTYVCVKHAQVTRVHDRQGS
jgi:hypothetical protein